jgi:hypothetical protein
MEGLHFESLSKAHSLATFLQRITLHGDLFIDAVTSCYLEAM